MVQLDYRDSRPIYEQIKQGLRRLVVSQAILPDEKLPSVRELAARLAINNIISNIVIATIIKISFHLTISSNMIFISTVLYHLMYVNPWI